VRPGITGSSSNWEMVLVSFGTKNYMAWRTPIVGRECYEISYVLGNEIQNYWINCGRLCD